MRWQTRQGLAILAGFLVLGGVATLFLDEATVTRWTTRPVTTPQAPSLPAGTPPAAPPQAMPMPRLVTPETALPAQRPAAPPPAGTTRFASTEVRIVDGDSLEVGGRRVRLIGIDAVELAQSCQERSGRYVACGRQARGALETLVQGGRVECVQVAIDVYQRSLARCTNQRGEDLNQVMVSQGWALAYDGDSTYAAEERAAAAARRGLHALQFTRPADFRRAQR